MRPCCFSDLATVFWPKPIGPRTMTGSFFTADGEPQYPDGTEARDVFIVEGAQERYGSKAAWNLV